MNELPGEPASEEGRYVFDDGQDLLRDEAHVVLAHLLARLYRRWNPQMMIGAMIVAPHGVVLAAALLRVLSVLAGVDEDDDRWGNGAAVDEVVRHRRRAVQAALLFVQEAGAVEGDEQRGGGSAVVLRGDVDGPVAGGVGEDAAGGR